VLRQGPLQWRFLLEHVETGAAHQAGVERAHQGSLVDEVASRRVDDPDALLHPREARIVEHALRFRCRRQVQREVIGRHAQFIHGHQLDADAGRDVARDERVVRDDAHPERAGALRDLLADAAEAGNAEGLALQFEAGELLLFPLSGLHRLIGGGDGTGQRQHQAERMLGDADAVGAWRVDDEDAAAAGGRHVDVVHTRSGASDDAELGSGGKEILGDLGGAADQ
jgi:hypothetical protein